MASQKRYDVVLLGASGFTGGLTAEYLAQAKTPRPLRWAIAGRNRQKLEALRDRLSREAVRGVLPDLLSADVGDDASVRALARDAQVLATTVGPYIRYGEPVVRACAEEGADYVDLTGEWVFVDRMLERYHARARDNKVKIVHACGFDSIPHDLGAYFTLKALRARGASLEHDKVTIEGFVRAGGTISGGTWHSALGIMGDMISHEREHRARTRELPIEGEGRHIGGTAQRIRYRSEIGYWAVPMPTIDPQVVQRSARLVPAYGQDFRYGHFLALRNFPEVVGALVGMSTLFTLAQIPPARALLLKLKQPGEGPDAHTRAKGWFRVTFLGEAGPHRVRCEVRGGDPGYGETAKMLAESALCLAFDRERLPQQFGSVPTVAAMGDALLDRLQVAGIRFEDRGEAPARSERRAQHSRSAAE